MGTYYYHAGGKRGVQLRADRHKCNVYGKTPARSVRSVFMVPVTENLRQKNR